MWKHKIKNNKIRLEILPHLKSDNSIFGQPYFKTQFLQIKGNSFCNMFFIFIGLRLRGGLDGDERRVLVDRARMAELFDGLLEAIAATSQVEDLLERWQVDAAEPGVQEDQPIPVGAKK